MRSDSETLAKNSDDSSKHMQQAVGNAQEMVITMSQVAAPVKQNSETVATADKLSIAVNSAAMRGGEAMDTVIKTMDDIADSIQRIGTITTLINNIAFRTNILALNVTAEAARAGEQGKGLVAVAEEIRHLVSRSANAVNGIRKLIDANADKAQSGSDQVHAIRHTIDDIAVQVQNVTQLVAQINHSTLKQPDSLSSLIHAVSELSSITQENAKLVEENTQIPAMVKHRAGCLEDVVAVLH